MLAPLVVLALLLTMPAVSYREGVVELRTDQVRTRDGHAEIIGPDSSVLHLDHQTTLDDGSGRVRLVDGRVFVRTATTPVDLDTPLGRLRLLPRGAYSVLVDAARAQLLVSVAVGRLTLDTPYGVTVVAGREMAMMTGVTARPWVTPFDPSRWDPFELWSDDRMARLAFGPDSPWSPTELARLGLVTDRPRAASATCSSWLAFDNPCWVVGTANAPAAHQAAKPSGAPVPKPPGPRP